jgi:hypothetical protein
VGIQWIHLTQDRNPLGSSCENRNETSGFIRSVEFLE